MSRLHLNVFADDTIPVPFLGADRSIACEIIRDKGEESSLLVVRCNVSWFEGTDEPFVNIEIPDLSRIRVNGLKV